MIGLPRSLQARVLALVLGLVAIVWAGTAAITWIDARHELERKGNGTDAHGPERRDDAKRRRE